MRLGNLFVLDEFGQFACMIHCLGGIEAIGTTLLGLLLHLHKLSELLYL